MNAMRLNHINSARRHGLTPNEIERCFGDDRLLRTLCRHLSDIRGDLLLDVDMHEGDVVPVLELSALEAFCLEVDRTDYRRYVTRACEALSADLEALEARLTRGDRVPDCAALAKTRLLARALGLVQLGRMADAIMALDAGPTAADARTVERLSAMGAQSVAALRATVGQAPH